MFGTTVEYFGSTKKGENEKERKRWHRRVAYPINGRIGQKKKSKVRAEREEGNNKRNGRGIRGFVVETPRQN